MSIRKTMYVKENSFRKLDDPFNDVAKKYVFYVKICDVPEGIPMATNPRDQKLTSGVAQAIKESLESNDGFFHLKNRGIVLSAKSCTYNICTKIPRVIFWLFSNLLCLPGLDFTGFLAKLSKSAMADKEYFYHCCITSHFLVFLGFSGFVIPYTFLFSGITLFIFA